jgi:hypothetical protein
MEDQFVSQSVGTSIKMMEELLADPKRGTLMDKTRALMCLYLSKVSSLSTVQLQNLSQTLANSGGNADGLAFLQHLSCTRDIHMLDALSSNPSAQRATSGAGIMGSIGRLADGVRSTTEGMLLVGMHGLKNIVASGKETPVCRIMEELMQPKGKGLSEKFLYLDPAAPSAPAGSETVSTPAPLRRGIVFVIGGGSYTEVQCLHEWGQKHGCQVSYGSTDMVSPAQFVQELCDLGEQLKLPIGPACSQADEAMVLQRAQRPSAEAKMIERHGENLAALGHQAEQRLLQSGRIGTSIVERLMQDAAASETKYYAWCLQAKLELEASGKVYN